jgi:hypothetical protein
MHGYNFGALGLGLETYGLDGESARRGAPLNLRRGEILSLIDPDGNGIGFFAGAQRRFSSSGICDRGSESLLQLGEKIGEVTLVTHPNRKDCHFQIGTPPILVSYFINGFI